MREIVLNKMKEVADIADCILVSDISDETVLLESGLDSLGFAILVAGLEEELGYDPFSLMEEPIYPRTLGEFVDIYQKIKP